MRNQVLSINQMRHLRELGVDTSKASMILLFFDEDGDELGWEVEDHGKDKVLYEYYDEEKEIWKSTNYSYLDAETGDYDHSYREDCGVLTLQDMLDIMPRTIDRLTDENVPVEKHYVFHIRRNSTACRIAYSWGSSDAVKFDNGNLMTAAYNMLCWLAENGYLGKERE